MTYARAALALGATPVETSTPAPGRPQPPIYPLEVGSHGGYLEVRSSPADGSCGVGQYPCRHPGVDVAGFAGTTVVAPESGTVVVATDGNSAPFVGYGPWLIVIQGDSGKFHLLAHLEPLTSAYAPLGARVIAGQQVGVTSSANHTHWEVRNKPVPDFSTGENNFTNNDDPIGWLSIAGIGAGTLLIVGGAAVFMWLIYQRRRRS